MFDIIDKINASLDEFEKGAKAIRPFLVYLGYRAAGGKNLKAIMPLCLAVELVHNGFLIQDDIIDKSVLRRNKQTIHTKFSKKHGEGYGASQAMMVADAAFFEALKLVNTIEVKNKSAVVENLMSVFLDTVYGEAMDVEFSYGDFAISDIWKMTELKTARYTFVGPLVCGAMMANASGNLLKTLEEYGLDLGVAFQLKDDELGVFGDQKTIGKSTISDMVEGKNTVLFKIAQDLARGSTKTKLKSLWGKRTATIKDLETIKEIFTKVGAIAWLESEIEKRTKAASAKINRITKDKYLAEIFEQITYFVGNRTK